MKNPLFLLYFILVFGVFGQNQIQQCSDTLNLDFEAGEKGMYVGCLNYENKMDGVGTLYYPDKSVYSGEFKNNEVEGKGELKFSNGSYTGSFLHGRYHGFGVETRQIANQMQTSRGMFLNGTLVDGQKEIHFDDNIKQDYSIVSGELTKVEQYKNDELLLIFEGDFYSNSVLKTGEKTEFDGNIIITSMYKDGVEQERRSNIENNYMPDNVSGAPEYIEVSLETEKNGDTKYIHVTFTQINKQYRFVFDTGAEMFSIGYRLFQELKEQGLVYEDLGVEVPTIGVRGEPIMNKIININELKIGDYTVYNTIAYVETLETA